VIAPDQLVTALATAAFPTFAVLIGIFVNNQRLSDLNRAVDVRFADTNRHMTMSRICCAPRCFAWNKSSMRA
jgi:hypothetical protein